jgi:hypothetical protein
MLFGVGADQESRDRVRVTLQVSNIESEERYLGLPTPQGRMTKENYKSTKGKLVKRFSNWVERHMSLGAKC